MFLNMESMTPDIIKYILDASTGKFVFYYLIYSKYQTQESLKANYY